MFIIVPHTRLQSQLRNGNELYSAYLLSLLIHMLLLYLLPRVFARHCAENTLWSSLSAIACVCGDNINKSLRYTGFMWQFASLLYVFHFQNNKQYNKQNIKRISNSLIYSHAATVYDKIDC